MTYCLFVPASSASVRRCVRHGGYETADVLDMQWLGYGVVNADAF